MTFLAREPPVANAVHLVGDGIKDTAAITVAFFAILTLGYKRKSNGFANCRLVNDGNQSYRDRCGLFHQKSRQNRVCIDSGKFLFR